MSGITSRSNRLLGIESKTEQMILAGRHYARVESWVRVGDETDCESRVWYETEGFDVHECDREAFFALEHLYQLLLIEQQVEQERIRANKEFLREQSEIGNE